MREIICRGRNPKMGWIYGSYIRHETRQLCPMGGDKLKPDEVEHYIARDSFADWNMPRKIELVPVEPETVGLDTGLVDKTGRRIFEGDIFQFPDETWESFGTSCGTEYNSYEVENCGVVGFEADYGGYSFVQYKIGENSVEADLHENRDILFSDFVRELAVIGNIYDNPELLEVEPDA